MTLETAQKIARLQRELLEAYDVDCTARAPGALLVPSAEGMSWWPGREGPARTRRATTRGWTADRRRSSRAVAAVSAGRGG